MTNKDEIKELFSESFKGFEKEVDPGLWDKIQSNLGTPGAGNAGQAASAGKAGLLKTILVGSISVAAITGGIYLYNSNETKEEANKELVETPVVSENSNEKESVVIENNIDDQLTEKIDGSTDPLIIKHREEIKKELIKDLVAADIINKEELVFNNADINDLLDKDLLDKLVNSKKEENVILKENNNNSKAEPTYSHNNKSAELSVRVSQKITNVAGGFKVNFITTSDEGNTYDWNFGNGESSSEANPTVVYSNKGIYKVSLNVTGENHKTLHKQIVVKAFEKSFLEVPNVLTPNNDGMNDYLIVRTKGIKEFGLSVVTLNGKVLYETSNAKFRWDGKDFNGNTLKSGTYIIVVAAIGEDGQEYVQSSELWIEK